MSFNQVLTKAFPVFKNKYVLTSLIFFVWLIFFDQNNLIARFNEVKKLNKLKAEKEYYRQKIETDQKRLNELHTDKDNLEKFAREQYLMKRPDEDIYVVIEK